MAPNLAGWHKLEPVHWFKRVAPAVLRCPSFLQLIPHAPPARISPRTGPPSLAPPERRWPWSLENHRRLRSGLPLRMTLTPEAWCGRISRGCYGDASARTCGEEIGQYEGFHKDRFLDQGFFEGSQNEVEIGSILGF